MTTMKTIAGLLLMLTGAVLAAAPVVIVSDSTAVDYRGKPNPYTKGETGWAPMSGWGEFAADACRPEVGLVNRSMGGTSSRTYCERRLAGTKRFFRKGGFLLLSFGSNDARPSAREPERATTADGTYPEYLGKIAQEAKQAGMRVVVISPPPFYHTVDGKFANPVLAPYAAAAKKFATDNGFDFIDLFAAMSETFSRLPDREVRSHYMFLEPGESPNWPKGRSDPLHFTTKGSRLIWSIIQREIERNIPELAACFRPLPHDPRPQNKETEP